MEHSGSHAQDGDSQEDARIIPFDPDRVSWYLPHIYELPKESSFETALSRVRLPDLESGRAFGLVVRLITDNNSFRPSVRLTGEPTIIDNSRTPDVFIRTYHDSGGDSVCIWGTPDRPCLLEISIPYAVQDADRMEPVPANGRLSLIVTAPAFMAEVNQAYLENNKNADGFEKSPRFPHWGREGERYEGECDISEFISLCGGELKLRRCIVLWRDSQEPAAGMDASIDFDRGTLQITGVPARSGLLMFRFLYSNGQQADLKDNDDIVEIVPSSFSRRIGELVDSLQNMPPKRAMAGNSIRHDILLPDSYDADRMSISGLVVSDSGLTAVYRREKKTLEITGMPGRSGLVSLTFTLLVKTDWNHTVAETVMMPLFEFRTDTGSMWKNLPTDPTAPYQIQDEEHAVIEAGARTILCASKRGRSHAHYGKFRDDNFKACRLETGWLVVAVSDGAGSARYSREGSRIICDTFCETMRRKLATGEYDDAESPDLESRLRSALLDAAHQGLDRIRQEAGTMSRTDPGTTVRDYSATLLGYVMKEFKDGWLIISIGIGDGVIGLLVQLRFLRRTQNII